MTPSATGASSGTMALRFLDEAYVEANGDLRTPSVASSRPASVRSAPNTNCAAAEAWSEG